MYGVFREWKNGETWERIHDALWQRVRKAARKEAAPTAAIVDGQSIRTVEDGEERGYDACKKVTSRERHTAVDTVSLPLALVVHPADWQDQHGVWGVVEELGEESHRLKAIFGNAAYGRNSLPDWMEAAFRWMPQTVLRPVDLRGFVVLPKRWIVERNSAWLANHRRHSRDYEETTASSEAFAQIAMISMMSERLAHTDI